MDGEFFLQARFFPNDGVFPLPPAQMREDGSFSFFHFLFPVSVTLYGIVHVQSSDQILIEKQCAVGRKTSSHDFPVEIKYFASTTF